MDCRALQGSDWYCLELVSESGPAIEATLHRLLRETPSIFGSYALEVFVPIARRDLGVFDLMTGGFIFVRSKHLNLLAKLKRITGITGMMTHGDDGKLRNVVRVPDSEVQLVIQQSRNIEASWSRGIKVGSFVRILDGQARGFCGHVVRRQPLTVEIQLLTKTLTVVTPHTNLLHLPDVPRDQRVFYYSPILQTQY